MAETRKSSTYHKTGSAAVTRRASDRKGGMSGYPAGTESGMQKAGRKPVTARKQQGIVRSSLSFTGTWRSYQARVLDNAAAYMEDGRIHIVAAPGSGKTTLGIELIARADAPCLILAPSITIREQWLSRIREGFGASEELLSNDIRQPAAITAITYQALHSCLRRKKSVEEDEDGSREETDYSRFDLYAALLSAGVKTFCLDEAHHLRSEWQKALEEVVKEWKDCTIISLTATPPYDSTPQQWERYISLCGPIDEEISVPELVKEGSLCPHQDYVYFNMPTPEEEAQVKKFRKESDRIYKKLMADEAFAAAVLTHRSFSEPESYVKLFGEKRTYLLALLSFVQEKKRKMPDTLAGLAGDIEIPPMDVMLLGALLQGFLFEDAESYDCDPDYLKSLADSLRAKGLIHKNKVELSSNSEVDKMLINSRGKLLSIQEIVKAEFASLEEELRLLVLTDFIRGEYLTAIGDETQAVEEMGVVPIFESVRRNCGLEADQLRLAALSGSVVILPETAKEAFLDMAEENGQKASLKECGAAGYYQAAVSGNGPRLTSYLTELFYQGYIRVLVGTKSLLGEGWDSPCINSLVLASFVGSFMLSNQMRGRAIRTMKGNPEKASNIWHLICMEPVWIEKEDGERNGRSLESCSADFATLRRRFDGFLGVHYEKDLIESGLDRLSYIQPPYGNRELNEINEKMVALADDRMGLIEKWDRTLNALTDMETVDGVGVCAKELKAESQQKKCRKQTNRSKAGTIAAAIAAVLLAVSGHFLLGLAAVGAAAAGFFKTSSNQKREESFIRPELFFKAVANAVFAALQELGMIASGDVAVSVEVQSGKGESADEEKCFACLRNGTEREKSVFAETLAEFMGGIGEQRYLLEALEAEANDRIFYPVPEVFGKKKEDARIFVNHIAPCIGPCNLIFTRSEDGKRALLKAGIQTDVTDPREEQSRVMRHKKVQNRQ